MAELAAILPVVSHCSYLALELYQFAASSPGEAKDHVKVAKAINNFASILKQVGTIIKEDDRLPSYEVRHFLHFCHATVVCGYPRCIRLDSQSKKFYPRSSFRDT
jgi:hypothetical protein